MTGDIDQQISTVLFWNPWSTVRFVARRTGLSESIVSRHLETKSYYEKLRIPVSEKINQRAQLNVYMITRSWQLDLTGLNLKPTYMAEVLMMNFSRLVHGREVISFINSIGSVSWAMSPWRPTRKGSLFDGLLKMETRDGNQILIGLVTSIPEINEITYEHFLKRWESWRKKTPNLPATLLFWNPKLTLADVQRMSSIPLFTNGDIACYVSEHGIDSEKENSWLYLNSKEVFKTSIPPWNRGIGLHRAVFNNLREQQFFSCEVRKTRHPGAETFGNWVKGKKQLQISCMIQEFLSMKSREIVMLRWLTQYPALDRFTFAEIATRNTQKNLNIARARRNFTRRIMKIQSRGYVEELVDYPTHYVITIKGMKVYGYVSGLDVENLSKTMGYPAHSAKFTFQQKHQDQILQIIKQMAREGIIESLGTESNRFIFYDIQRSFLEPIKSIEIRPDIAGIIRLNNWSQYFWLEVDRGTRKGKKIIWKLEKLFLIFHAKFGSDLIPPILFIVDCDNGKNENRIRYLSKKLKALYQRYPNTPLQVLLTSADLLEQIGGSFLSKRIWRKYFLGTTETATRSLEELLHPGSVQTKL